MAALFEEWQPWRSNRFLVAVILFIIAVETLAVWQMAQEAAPVWQMALVFVVVTPFLFFFALMGLRTRVTPDALEVRMVGLRRRIIPWTQVERVEAAEVRPVRDYGGWGIRYGGKQRGWIYNVRGTGAVRVLYTDGRLLVVGSQEPEDLARAIEAVQGRAAPKTSNGVP